MQKQIKRLMVAAMAFGALLPAGCQKPQSKPHVEHPAEVKKIDGTELNRVTLTDKAMRRIDLKTDQVREQQALRLKSTRKVVPYSSLIYDPKGQTWLYTSPQARTFVRQKVDVDYIEGDKAFLTNGPPAGTVIASMGVAELYGTEFKVGH